MPTEQKQIVYMETPISELPEYTDGYFTCFFISKRGEKITTLVEYFAGVPSDKVYHNGEVYTHYLKPVELSTFVEEQVKELKKEIVRVKKQRNEFEQLNISLTRTIEKVTGRKSTGIITSKTKQ